MTVTYGFYDSLSGDRKYNARQMSQLFKGIITDGVFSTVGGGLVVTVNSGMTLNVASGRAWFNYTWTDNDATIVVTVLASEAVLNRIDSVVVEVNSDTAVRANSIKVVKGTPATTPVAPAMANTATLHQYPLANIYVAGGVTSINSGNITNTIGTASCPFASGAVPSFDFGPLLVSWQTAFGTWFTNLVNQLSGSQVTNLQNQIDVLNATKADQFGWIPVTDSWTYVSANTITVPSNATTKYQKGFGIRFKQGGAYKYMYVTGVASTLLTVTAGTVSTVANATITDVAYCIDPGTAFGFPSNFDCAAPTWDTTTIDNGTGGQQPTAGGQYFSIHGGYVEFGVVLGGSGAFKNGSGTLIQISSLPATIPAMAEPTLMPLGSAYTVANSVGLIGVAVQGGGVPIAIRFSSNINDNDPVIFTGTKIRYKY